MKTITPPYDCLGGFPGWCDHKVEYKEPWHASVGEARSHFQQMAYLRDEDVTIHSDIGVRLRLLHIFCKHTHNKVTHKKAAHSTLQETHTVLYIKAVAIPLSETEQCVVLVGVCHQLACGQWCTAQSPKRKYHTQTPEHEPEEERRASQEKYMRKRRDRRKHWRKTLHEHCS